MINPIRMVKAAIAKREEAKAAREAKLNAARESAAQFSRLEVSVRRMTQGQLAHALSNGSLQAARAQFDIDMTTIRNLSK